MTLTNQTDYLAIKQALLAWSDGVVGAGKTAWANTNFPRLSRPYATFEIATFGPDVGIAEEHHELNNGVIEKTYIAERTMTLRYRLYAEAPGAMSEVWPTELMESAILQLRSQVLIDAFRAAGLAFLTHGALLQRDEQDGDRWEWITEADLTLSYRSKLFDDGLGPPPTDGQFIEKVGFTINDEPSFDVDSDPEITVESRIAASEDDSLHVGSTHNFLSGDPGLPVGGPSFLTSSSYTWRNLGIPKNALIISAEIVFTGSQSETGDTMHTRISGDVGSDFAPIASDADFHSRVRSLAFVDWDAIEHWFADIEYTSPDLTTIIQEIVNLPDWTENADLTILHENNGSDTSAQRRATSFDFDPARAPLLRVVYDTHPAGPATPLVEELTIVNDGDDWAHLYNADALSGGPNAFVGNNTLDSVDSTFLYRNIQIPNNATLTKATLTFIPAVSDSAVGMLTNFQIEDVDDAMPIAVDADFHSKIANLHATLVAWDFSTAWVSDRQQVSVDIKAIIDAIRARPGWGPGQAMHIFWRDNGSPSGASRRPHTHEESVHESPRLRLEYTLP